MAYKNLIILFITVLISGSKTNKPGNQQTFAYFGEYKTKAIKYVDTQNADYNRDFTHKNITAHIIFYKQNDTCYLQVKLDKYPNKVSYACKGSPREHKKCLYLFRNCYNEHLDDGSTADIIFQKSNDSLRLTTLIDKRDYWLYDNLELVKQY